MRETGEKFDMVMNFGNLQFINDQSFEATGSNSLQGINTPSQNIPWVYAYWDKTNGIGEATINYGNATITSAVPEPGTTALLLAGLAGVAGVVAARRRRNTLGAQTPGTDTTPTPEGATAE